MDAIVLFGIQGSGKGTQALLLSKQISYQHINIGDALRMQVSAHTELGQEVKTVIESGSLVEDDLIFRLLGQIIDPQAKGIVFDGFPRTIAQAEYLSKIYRVKLSIYLDLSEDAATLRMTSRRVCSFCKSTYNTISHPPREEGICDQCGKALELRNDDTKDAIHKRFEAFYRETFPLIEYFEKKGILHKVDASLPIEPLAAEIYSLYCSKYLCHTES